MRFQQRPEGSEGVGQLHIWERIIAGRVEGTARQKGPMARERSKSWVSREVMGVDLRQRLWNQKPPLLLIPPPTEEEKTESNQEVANPDHYIKHPLQNRWALWFFKNDKSKTWQANLQLISEFDAVEDCWALYNHVQFLVI